MARASGLDPRFDALLDFADSGSELESSAAATIFADRNLAVPSPADYARMPFPFLRDVAERAQAVDALAAAIAKLVEEPAIDAAIAEATERFDMAEQERLRHRKRDINERLRMLTGQTRD